MTGLSLSALWRAGANLGIPYALKDYSPPPGSPNTNLGTDLSAHHPVSFPYTSSLPNSELAGIESLPNSLRLSGNNELHCSTCHDPHDDTFGNFLAMDNSSSQLCEACHLLTGWKVSAHNQCKDCHTPHFAVQGEWLLTFISENACLDCHSGPIVHLTAAVAASKSARTGLNISQSAVMPAVDIKRQTEKISSHRASMDTRILSQQAQLAERRSGRHTVTCVGCHRPHLVNRKKASAPYASGMLMGVSGVDRNGVEVASVTYEYEVCFKCHSDYSSDFAYVPRVIESTNIRLSFDTGNPSYHPIVGMGNNLNIPSIPSSYEPALNSSNIIYCTDCHRDDAGGSKGPHGSSFAPILREQYELVDGTPENYQNYALCYRCHNRDSILQDRSFRKNSNGKGGHSGHLAKGAPCAACHDPHGVNVSSLSSGETGDHTHLINFATMIVAPKPGNVYPIFKSNGTFSGSCTLVCHGRAHINETYPQGGISSKGLSPLSPGLRDIRRTR